MSVRRKILEGVLVTISTMITWILFIFVYCYKGD